MAKRPVRIIFSPQRSRALVLTCLLTLTAWELSLACSRTTQHRVLSFFFDGVPEPGGARDTAGASAGGQGSATVEPRLTAPPRQYYAHTPYRENRCGGCHDSTSGQLIRAVAEGLCLTCHSKLTADARFVHGPVAVDDCTACHHFHGSAFPNLLLFDPVATCLNCHDRVDLSAGDCEYQSLAPTLTGVVADAAPDVRNCVECHDPHVGNNRYFLKKGEP